MLACLLCFLPGHVKAQHDVGSNADLADLKAAFIYNFARFTRWPEEELQALQNITFCYDRENETAGSLHKLAGRELFDKTVVVTGITGADVTSCQLIYLSEGALGLSGNLAGNTLTISDSHHFVDAGGMIEMFVADNRVRFNVNLRELQKNKLEVAARLLNLAETIRK